MMKRSDINAMVTEYQTLEIDLFNTMSITQKEILVNATEEDINQLAHELCKNRGEQIVRTRLLSAQKEMGGFDAADQP